MARRVMLLKNDTELAPRVAPLLLANGLVKKYGKLLAVDSVSFAIAGGEVLALLGPNGSGKTTILRAVGATLRLDRGRVSVAGYDTAKSPREAKRRLGVVHQEDTLDPDLSVWENLLIHARYLEIPRDKANSRAQELLERFDLARYRNEPIAHLSGGLRRRLALARAFFQAQVLILDEPTTGLDPEARLCLWGDIRNLLADGVAVLLTTHDMEEAERLADRVLLLDQGRARSEGTPAELIARETTGHVFEIRLPVSRLDEAAEIARKTRDVLGDGARVARYGGFIFCEIAVGDENSRECAEQGLRAWATHDGLPLTVRPATLGDVYLTATGQGLEE